MPAHTESTNSATDSPLGAAVAAITLIPAIYVAFFVIDWTSDSMFSNDSMWRYIAPVIFCIAVPSLIGSVVAAIVNASRRA